MSISKSGNQWRYFTEPHTCSRTVGCQATRAGAGAAAAAAAAGTGAAGTGAAGSVYANCRCNNAGRAVKGAVLLGRPDKAAVPRFQHDIPESVPPRQARRSPVQLVMQVTEICLPTQCGNVQFTCNTLTHITDGQF